MTGTIVQLASSTRTGLIRTPEGLRIPFSASAVLGDFENLAVGNRVSFDVTRAWPQGSAVRVLREPAPVAPKKPDSAPDLRYAGFDQAGNVRSYRFDAVSLGSPVQRFVVTVDLALLLKHRIGVQEAPVLCLRKLAADLKDRPQLASHQLGNDDLLAYASSRPVPAQRKRPRPPVSGRRGAPPPCSWKHPPGSG